MFLSIYFDVHVLLVSFDLFTVGFKFISSDAGGQRGLSQSARFSVIWI
jgi:hypothetical protein